MASSRSTLINQTLMRIPRRADSVDRPTLVRTFVAVGPLFGMLGSVDHQVLFGRRGTGKTHALLCLANLVEQSGDVAVYIDLRTVGSAGGLYTDPHVDLAYRATQLVVDTLESVHDSLVEYALTDGCSASGELLPRLDALAEAASAVQVIGEVEHETKIGDTARTAASTQVGISAGGPRLSMGASASREASHSTEARLRRSGQERHHVLFGPVGRALQRVIQALAGSRLWILLDEWSSVPLELQPLLADLLRRSLFPAHGVTVKIAAIERRSRFRDHREGGDYVGLELGADVAAGLDLDNFLIFDREDELAQAFFRTLLFKHALVQVSQPARLGRATAGANEFVQASFKKDAFAELVRAAEGVPRDAINLVALAAQYADNSSIGIAEVRKAAREWYLRDKQGAISANPDARHLLRLLVDEVVGRRRARTFLLDQADQHTTAIRDLYDARLLHILRHGIVAPDQPGTQYDGFAIDYGCYVALMSAKDDFHSGNWYDTWLRAQPDMAPDNFHGILRSVVDLHTLYTGQ